jgi:hypothetical protein
MWRLHAAKYLGLARESRRPHQHPFAAQRAIFTVANANGKAFAGETETGRLETCLENLVIFASGKTVSP